MPSRESSPQSLDSEEEEDSRTRSLSVCQACSQHRSYEEEEGAQGPDPRELTGFQKGRL